jgi:exopolyphosphatase/guanosine-5'-triphosphate,3'-diphosphate pyrophosphatase
VDATGRLADDALARTFDALDDYAAQIREHGATRVRLCATSAVRDAANGEVFVRGVEERLGVTPDILTGEQEAALAFDGVMRHLTGEAPGPVLVVDIGGGSTELVLGTAGQVERAHSMDIGSVRLHERHLASDPPTPQQVEACIADIDAHLDAAPVRIGAARTVVGVAGSTLTVWAGVLGLPTDDRTAVDQARLEVAEVVEYVEWLVGLTVAQRLALPYMDAGRADVIGAGALILARVLGRADVRELVASEADILDGIAWSIV